MPNKILTQEFVTQYFLDRGWIIQGTYVNSKVPIKCICSNGHTNFTRWADFRRGEGPDCGYRDLKCN